MPLLRRRRRAGRGQSIEDAYHALTFDRLLGGREHRRRAREAVKLLTDDERAWVIAFEAGEIAEHGALVEIIERRFGY